ncbi:MAG: hypothetical protein WC849_00840 [Candidatus Paceibacterota bacterium]
MTRYIAIIVYFLALATIVFLASIGPKVQNSDYNNYVALVFSLSFLVSFLPLFVYFEWKKRNALKVVIRALTEHKLHRDDAIRGKIEISAKLENSPKLKFTEFKYKDDTVYYSVYYGLNDITIRFK